MPGERCQSTLDALLHPLISNVAWRGGKGPAPLSSDSRGVSVTNPFMVTGSLIVLSGFDSDFRRITLLPAVHALSCAGLTWCALQHSLRVRRTTHDAALAERNADEAVVQRRWNALPEISGRRPQPRPPASPGTRGSPQCLRPGSDISDWTGIRRDRPSRRVEQTRSRLRNSRDCVVQPYCQRDRRA
jgi:hypothetical protein